MGQKGNFDFDLIFLLGDGATFSDKILIEAEKYNDILIGSFIDNYENLAIKTYLGFQERFW